MRRQLHAQIDLFAGATRPVEIAGADRQKALALLQALLSEVVMKPATQLNNSSKEAGDEQDLR